MQIYAVEKEGKTISVFASTLGLLTFLYLHAEDFGFHDDNEDLYDKVAGGNTPSVINPHLAGNVQVKEWTTGIDTYTHDAEEKGKDVSDIAVTRKDKSWCVTMDDDSKRTVVAPFMPIAASKAQSEYILENGRFSSVKNISKI